MKVKENSLEKNSKQNMGGKQAIFVKSLDACLGFYMRSFKIFGCLTLFILSFFFKKYLTYNILDCFGIFLNILVSC